MSNTAQLAVTLESGDVVSSAEVAARALEDLQSQMTSDIKEAATLQKQLRNLGKETVVNANEFKALKDAIDAKKKSTSDAQLDVLKLGNAFKQTKKPTSDMRSTLQNFGKEAKDLGGPLGQVFGRMEQLSKFAQTGAARVVLMTGAVVGLAVAAAYGAKKIFDASFDVYEASEKQAIALQGVMAAAGSKDLIKDAAALGDMIKEVTHNSAASKEEVTGLAAQLAKAGLKGNALKEALEAATIAQVTQGSEGASAYVTQATALKDNQKGLAKLATMYKDNLGGAAEKAMLSTDALAKRLSENVDGMFSGVDFTPLQKSKKQFIELFNESSEIGKAIKSVFQTVSQGIADSLTWLIKKATGYVLDWEIGLVEIQIAYYDLKIAVKEFAADFVVGYQIISEKIEKFGAKLYDTVQDVKKWWKELDFVQIGFSIVDGLVQGIAKGGAAIKKAVMELGSLAKDAFKEALGIHSPSKEFAKLGLQLPKGLEAGIDQGQSSLDQKVRGIVAPMSATPTSNDNSRSSVVNYFTISVNASGNEEAVSTLEAQLTEMLTRVSQREGVTVG